MSYAARIAIAGLALASAAVSAQSTWLQELEAGCNAGKGQDCANLGDQLGMKREGKAKARDAYEKGCKLNSLSACVGLYQALSLGEGGPADPARAKALEPKVCNTGIISMDVHLQAKGLCKG
jgi:hypothetical protein